MDATIDNLVMTPSFNLEVSPIFITIDKSQHGIHFIDILNSGADALIDPRFVNTDFKVLGELISYLPEEVIAQNEIKVVASKGGQLFAQDE
jgi:hypothetical protein